MDARERHVVLGSLQQQELRPRDELQFVDRHLTHCASASRDDDSCGRRADLVTDVRCPRSRSRRDSGGAIRVFAQGVREVELEFDVETCRPGQLERAL